jgi:hypothetical protein
VSQKLAVDINSFFDIKERFLQNLAFVLKIDLSRIKVVSITPGSTVVDYLILEDPKVAEAPIAEPQFDTSKNVDPVTAALLKNMTTEEQQAFLAPTPPDSSSGATESGDSGTTSSSGDSGNNTTGDAGTGGGGAVGANSSDPGVASPSSLASAELMQVLAALQTALADGSMATTTGLPILDVKAKVL